MSIARMFSAVVIALLSGVGSASFVYGNTTPKFVYYDLTTSLAPVHSSTKTNLRLQVQLNGTYTPQASSQIYMDMILTNGSAPDTLPGETHDWQFFSASPTFVHLSTKKNTLSIATGSRLTPFGQIKINFTPLKSTALKCPTGESGVESTGSVSGIVRLISHSGWGSVGSRTRTFAFPKGSTLNIADGCKSFGPPSYCQSGFEWFSPDESYKLGNGLFASHQISGSFVSVNGVKQPVELRATQIIPFTQPPGSQRFDELEAVAKAETYDSVAHALSIKSVAGKGQPFSGSAQVSTNGTFTSTNDFSCPEGKQTKTEHDDENDQADWANGISGSLNVRMVIGGSFSIPNTVGKAGLIQYTISK